MTGNDLDLALSMGYFRMQQQVFTCHFLRFDETIYTAHWLRITLDNVAHGRTQRSLLARNRAFQVTAKPFLLTDELKDLYARYRRSITFDAPPSIEDCLFGDDPAGNRFDTRLIEVRDHNRLIAAGIFDNGNESIAGIMNVYDPDYRRYSLGKYLMLLKIDYARQQQKTYYYPGYVVNDYAKFDYKVDAAASATEFYDAANDEWLPFSWDKLRAISRAMMGT